MKNLIQSSRIQNPDITSYDLLKTLAIILMIVDHVGYYFFPMDNWWRVFGRLSLPIWFFLIGYARSRDVGPALWLGMLLLILGDMAAGMSILPLNILAAVLVVRLILDPWMEWLRQTPLRFWLGNILLMLLIYWTNIAVEYGTLALLMAMTGYWARCQTVTDLTARRIMRRQFIFSTLAYCYFEWLGFGFSQVQFAVMAIGMVGLMGLLESFRPANFVRLSLWLPRPLTRTLQFTGRHSLAIYVGHLLILKALGLYWEPARFHAGQFHFYSETGV